MVIASSELILARCISVHFSVRLMSSFSGLSPVFASKVFAVKMIGTFVLSVKFFKVFQNPSSFLK